MTESYFALVRRFPLRRLRTEAELDEAIAMIDSLIDGTLTDSGEQDYLDVLGDLVERYEAEHHPMPELSASAFLEGAKEIGLDPRHAERIAAELEAEQARVVGGSKP